MTIPERIPIAKKLKEHKRLVNEYGNAKFALFPLNIMKVGLFYQAYCTAL